MRESGLQEAIISSRLIIEVSGLPVARVARSYQGDGLAVVEIIGSDGEVAKGISSSGSLETATYLAIEAARREWMMCWASSKWEV